MQLCKNDFDKCRDTFGNCNACTNPINLYLADQRTYTTCNLPSVDIPRPYLPTGILLKRWELLFDAGDGCTAALFQKSRKINHVFISHSDRGHLSGLLQFNLLNARNGMPVIYYPKNPGSFPALEAFTKKSAPVTPPNKKTPAAFSLQALT